MATSKSKSTYPSDGRKRKTAGELDAEEIQKARDYIVSHGLAAPFKLIDYGRCARWPFCVEGYVVGDVEIVCKVRVIGDTGQPADFVAILKPLSEDRLTPDLFGKFLVEPVAMTGRNHLTEMEYPVLVVVAKSVQNPKRVAPWVIPSVARLEFGDATPGVGAQSFEDGLPTIDDPTEEFVFPVVDREGGSIGRGILWSMGERKLPGEMVEGRTQILNDIPNEDPPIEDWWPLKNLPPQDALASFGVLLRDNSIGIAFKEPLDACLERVKVGIRPVELGEHSVECGHHFAG